MTGDPLTLIWFAIIAFAVFMYVLLDGFVLGIGILFMSIHGEDDRDVASLGHPARARRTSARRRAQGAGRRPRAGGAPWRCHPLTTAAWAYSFAHRARGTAGALLTSLRHSYVPARR